MKRLLLVSLLIGTSSLLAMEAPEPMDIGPDNITLVSAQGKEFVVPVSAALRSPVIKAMLGSEELAEFQAVEAQSNHISFTEISSSTLEFLIPLLESLDRLLLFNEKVAQSNPEKQLYIPRRLQHRVNKRLSEVSNQAIAALYQAADFLDVPFIINAVAAVIADRIEGKIDAMEWRQLRVQEREKLINQKAAQFGIHVKQEYILKQVTFRKSGITQEYSIADYIAEHGQLQLDRQNGLDLNNKKLTSLFGIDRLYVKNNCQILYLSSNCFFDIALDVQSVSRPFQGFGQLRVLYLDSNQLSHLPEHIFAGLAQLQWLNLDHNQLSTLPEHVFADFAQLEVLYLSANELSDLPEHLFAGLTQLRELYLYSNQLNNLPEHVFAGLTQLRELGLAENQLSNLPEHVFAGLAQLQELYLDLNQLSEQEKQRIKEQLPNTRIRFD